MSEAADRARAAIARGDLIAAYDATLGALEDGEQSDEIRHLQVLALARMGDTERAMALFESHGLSGSQDPHQQAIGARLLKDRALALPGGAGRQAALLEAAAAYQAIYAASGDAYPGINAASLFALGGDRQAAQDTARAILADPAIAAPGNYYDEATRAEALALLGQFDECAQSLAAAARLIGKDQGALSTTCRQMELVAGLGGLSPQAVDALLAPVRPDAVIHFCGHIFAENDAHEAELAARIAQMLEEHRVGFAYGALAAGGDVLVAEAVLARGGELHVVLPFAPQDFIAQSVCPAGESWVRRYQACLDRAASVTLASEMRYVGDPQQFSYASAVAMGLSRLRAQHLGSRLVQLAIWDGQPATGVAGTGADVAAWRGHGEPTVVIDPGPVARDFSRADAPMASRHPRALAAILFTDFPGFSKLAEEALPEFWNGVMGEIGQVLDAHGERVMARNSWGDAIYAVADSAGAAAEIALALQTRLAGFDYRRLGLEGGHGMRIGAHFGPAYHEKDHITGQMNFYGSEVSRAARIEPVTPPGAVFVTEPFAAILALEAADRFRCRYVGKIALAKGFGTYPMYLLTGAQISG